MPLSGRKCGMAGGNENKKKRPKQAENPVLGALLK